MWRVLARVWMVAAGLGFACFLLEEAIQVLTFASFVKEISPQTRQAIVDTAYGFANAIDVLNYINVLNPPMFVAYRSYARAARVWTVAQAEGFGLRPPSDRLDWVSDLTQGVGLMVAATLFVWAATKVIGSERR
ncbi:MAG: hypothetical protein QXY39_07275 [Thermofilaceae archaeon]